MNTVNFLPSEIREAGFRKRKILFNVILGLLVMTNIVLFSHTIHDIKKTKKETKKASHYNDKVISVNAPVQKNDALVFFQQNIDNNFNYDAININKNKLAIKFSIKNNSEFIEYVNKIEENKECKIEYLVAPYQENEDYKFDVGLEVLQ